MKFQFGLQKTKKKGVMLNLVEEDYEIFKKTAKKKQICYSTLVNHWVKQYNNAYAD
jgi:predicted DNA binding CopG/RHH family protein|tara:strand:+ start:264 stop:431 length:168 start_codon:yes stop_codon:yes gene_type:complete